MLPLGKTEWSPYETSLYPFMEGVGSGKLPVNLYYFQIKSFLKMETFFTKIKSYNIT